MNYIYLQRRAIYWCIFLLIIFSQKEYKLTDKKVIESSNFLVKSTLSTTFLKSTAPPTADTSNDGDYPYPYINRTQYKLAPPKRDGVPLNLPVKRVIIGHTVTPNCSNFVRKIS